MHAYASWCVAAAHWTNKASAKKDNARKGMTPEQITQAQCLSREWVEKNPTLSGQITAQLGGTEMRSASTTVATITGPASEGFPPHYRYGNLVVVARRRAVVSISETQPRRSPPEHLLMPTCRTATDLIASATLLSNVLAEEAVRRDAERIVPHAEMKALRAHGIQTARIPAAYGGPQTHARDYARIMMDLAAGDPNVAQMLQPHFVLTDWLRVDGTHAQRVRYYQAVLSGHLITNAFAERGTKTPGDFATTLLRDGKNLRLNGTKFYCTGSLIADQFYVLAVDETHTLALAIIPVDRAGVSVIDDWDGMGQRTTGSGTVKLEKVLLDEDEVIRLPDYRTRRTFVGAAAQLGHAAIDAGIARAALNDAIWYARDKARPVIEAGVDTAAQDPYVIHSIGEMSVLSHAAEAMVLRAGDAVEAGVAAFEAASTSLDEVLSDATIAVAEAKSMATQASLRVSEMLYNVSGASATLSKYGFDRHWRNARAHTTHDPVSYKHKVIGDYLLGNAAPPLSTKF